MLQTQQRTQNIRQAKRKMMTEHEDRSVLDSSTQTSARKSPDITMTRRRKRTRPRGSLSMFAAVLATLFVLTPPQTLAQQDVQYGVQYHESPELLWRNTLGDYSLLPGNTIAQSPFDDDILYATTFESDVAVLSAKDGAIKTFVKPTPRDFLASGQEWTTTCQSGFAFGNLADGRQFLAYAVADEAPEGSEYAPKTRIISVSIPDHKEMWSSTALPGSNAGSPVLYQTRNGKTYLAMTHNSELIREGVVTVRTGRITILDAEQGRVVWTESEWSRDEAPRGYGAVGVASNPALGKYEGGQDNQNDLLVWASSKHDGSGNLGFTFAFQLPMEFGGTELEVDDLATVVLKKVRWNSLASPTFGNDGSTLFFGVTGNQLRGWTGSTSFDATANWASDLSSDDVDSTAALPSSPTISYDGERLFALTSYTKGYGLDTSNGNRLWDMEGESSFLSKAVVSPDDERVYFIQSIDGRVMARDQRNGTMYWRVSCDTYHEDCSNSVKADFTLSRRGENLYYADVQGRILALQLGDLVVEEYTPPIDIFSDTGLVGASQGTDGPSVGGSVALIILAALVAVGSSYYIMITRRDKGPPTFGGARRRVEEARFEDDYDIHGPDPYEDTLIRQHSSEDSWIEQKSSMGSETGFDDEFLHISSSADKLSVLMGTSNKIAPLREDFSLGAAVAV